MIQKILKEIFSYRDAKKAKLLAGFFKTGRGQYGEGDLFLGITVPVSRKIAHKHGGLSLPDIEVLLKNKYHEVRLIALLILVYQYTNATNPKKEISKKRIVNFYLKNTKYINNWDLVDLSASRILGDYLLNKDRKILFKLAKSKNFWERRIAIISTFAFIYKGESQPTIDIAYMLLNDPQNLIHKACGWMLREVGKRVNESILTAFLDKHVLNMPRTTLRYAIERLPEAKRKYYLKLR